MKTIIMYLKNQTMNFARRYVYKLQTPDPAPNARKLPILSQIFATMRALLGR